jgi:hypothetical protein
VTKEQASRILDVIDEILGDHGITVVTEDDRDEYERTVREEDNTASIFGSIYYELKDALTETDI